MNREIELTREHVCMTKGCIEAPIVKITATSIDDCDIEPPECPGCDHHIYIDGLEQLIYDEQQAIESEHMDHMYHQQKEEGMLT